MSIGMPLATSRLTATNRSRALLIEPPAPTETAPDRRRKFSVIQGQVAAQPQSAARSSRRENRDGERVGEGTCSRTRGSFQGLVGNSVGEDFFVSLVEVDGGVIHGDNPFALS
jgi:hypothetical protein